MLTPQVILTEVLYNAYNSYVNAEYHYNKYLNEVLRKILWFILEQMFWLGVEGGHKEDVSTPAHKDNWA